MENRQIVGQIEQEDSMHGSIFVLLKRFVENRYDYSTWIKLAEQAGLGSSTYQMQQLYPTREIFALLQAASHRTGISAYELMEQFGEFIVPDLLLIYKKYLQPEWRTYELLLNTEEAMHGAVRRQENQANPPKLLVTKKGNRQLIVDYHSKRRMAGVAIGIIKGIATYFEESEQVRVTCLTGQQEERVQIQVEFGS
jgi:hypothetical protein